MSGQNDKSHIPIKRKAAARIVMLPASEHERLARRDQIALTPTELSEGHIRSLRAARAPSEARALNRLLNDAPVGHRWPSRMAPVDISGPRPKSTS